MCILSPVSWLDAAAPSGRLGLCYCPGKNVVREGVRWARDLDADLNHLITVHDVNVVVCLLSDAELRALGVGRDYAAQVKKAGLILLQLPIIEMFAPEDMREAMQVIEEIFCHLDRGSKCVLHCRGGVGRAGMLGGCLLIRMGICVGVKEAIDHVRRRRCKRAVESRSQEKFIANFARLWESGEAGGGAAPASHRAIAGGANKPGALMTMCHSEGGPSRGSRGKINPGPDEQLKQRIAPRVARAPLSADADTTARASARRAAAMANATPSAYREGKGVGSITGSLSSRGRAKSCSIEPTCRGDSASVRAGGKEAPAGASQTDAEGAGGGEGGARCRKVEGGVIAASCRAAARPASARQLMPSSAPRRGPSAAAAPTRSHPSTSRTQPHTASPPPPHRHHITTTCSPPDSPATATAPAPAPAYAGAPTRPGLPPAPTRPSPRAPGAQQGRRELEERARARALLGNDTALDGEDVLAGHDVALAASSRDRQLLEELAACDALMAAHTHAARTDLRRGPLPALPPTQRRGAGPVTRGRSGVRLGS